MKVKIGNTWTDANDEPIMIVLNDKDKENIKNMHPSAIHYCGYPKGMNSDEILKWMKEDKFKKLTIVCEYCGKHFEVITNKYNLFEEDDNFICDACEKVYKTNWPDCGEEVELKEESEGDLTPLQEQMDRITEYFNENLDDDIVEGGVVNTVISILEKYDKSINTWTTGNGRKIHISDMEIDHIINTIKMLERRAIVKDKQATRAFIQLDESELYPPIYYKLVKERNKREEPEVKEMVNNCCNCNCRCDEEDSWTLS